jgi:hypothetical protein
MRNLNIRKAFFIMIALVVSSCVSTDPFLSVYVINQSEERIFVQFVSKGYGWEIFRETIQPRHEKRWTDYAGRMLEPLLANQDGWIVHIYPDSLFPVPHDSLKTIPPLKQWDVAVWKDLENLGGIFEYP